MAEWIAVGFYGVALLVAGLRQVAAWTNGWRSFGRVGTVVLIAPSSRREQHGVHPHAVVCIEHSDLYLPLGSQNDDYGKTQRSAVTPAKSGTRQWTFRVTRGTPMSWPRWTWRCLKLAAARRFLEPKIDMCPSC